MGPSAYETTEDLEQVMNDLGRDDFFRPSKSSIEPHHKCVIKPGIP